LVLIFFRIARAVRAGFADVLEKIIARRRSRTAC
jgi:hypothetical protein